MELGARDHKEEPRHWLVGIADPVNLAVIEALSEVEQASASDLAIKCQASKATLRRHLDAMIAYGILVASPGEGDGTSPGRPPKLFELAPAIRKSVRALLGEIAPGPR